MLIFQKVAELQEHIAQLRAKGKTIGFAPTMGALHEGHLSLITLANAACDVSVASIFVNPTQFNDPKDLEKYPRMPEKDGAMLESAHCDILFMPPVSEVYPPGQNLTITLDFGILDKVMEGKFRPGHFAGMATVVNRLLDIVKPDQLFMGQKDFQQLTIVRNMIAQLNLPIKLVLCETLRESDGLAMSSRNMRLTPEMRQVAPVIYNTLTWIKEAFRHEPADRVASKAMHALEEAGLRPEYVEIVNAITLESVKHWDDASFIVVCTAAFAGEVRLIDNLILKS